jgi:long-subunit fatty acid transport protein
MSKVISLGIALKIYYYRLYENIATTDLGIDAGGIARLSDNLTLGIVVQDIGSKYKWDTSSLYGDQGSSTTEPFPLLRKIGMSYAFNDNAGLLSLDLENSNKNTNIIRMGGELYLSELFTVRAGLDHWDLQDPAQAAPTFGFTVRTSSAKLTPVINYAYVIEPYGLFGMHIISLSTRF